MGLEYGRECYAHTAAPSPEPTSLVGKGACNIACKGDAKQSCGAGNQLNIWGVGSVTFMGTASAPATSTIG